jgi:protein tyrosine/serine phosphatase
LRHYGVVHEGVLYRCGQPTPEQLDELIRRHNLKTVISFRGSRDPEDPDAWERAERGVCAARGAEFVTIPCNHKNPPGRAHLEEFLGVLRNRSRHAVLVHCRIGQQRTLLFCALYRVHIQGIDPRQAEQEMDRLGFNTRHRRHQRLLAAFRELSAKDAIRTASAESRATCA